MCRLIDLIGQKFGRLTVIARASNSASGKVRWVCQCDCGNPQSKIVLGDSLKLGLTTSCGCKYFESNKNKRKTHGDTNTRLFRIWSDMKARCDYFKSKEYHNYGGRGITYCSEWSKYESFKAWALSNGYQDNLTLERIDCNKNYCPENCTWATMKEQQNNKRNTIRFSVNGEEHSVSEWADITGIAASTLTWRLRHGWSENEMFMPTNLNNRNIRKQKESNL